MLITWQSSEVFSIRLEGDREFVAVFPVHPRTAKILEQSSVDKIILFEPLSYFEFIYLVHIRGAITDSGGIRGDTVLGIPCIPFG
jgi:UDP-N-acetylglucosamine 2-epimerase